MKTNEPFPEFLTAAEVAGVLNVSPMTIYRHLRKNHIAYTRIGKHFRISQEECNRIVREGIPL